MFELRQQLHQYKAHRAELAASQAVALVAGALVGGLFVWAVVERVGR